jgi:hypothetical protein
LVGLGIHLSGHPADTDALELVTETGGGVMQLAEVTL